MSARNDKMNRLRRARYRAVGGWVPEDEARTIAELIEAHRPVVERILAEPPRPVGRPRKQPTAED